MIPEAVGRLRWDFFQTDLCWERGGFTLIYCFLGEKISVMTGNCICYSAVYLQVWQLYVIYTLPFSVWSCLWLTKIFTWCDVFSRRRCNIFSYSSDLSDAQKKFSDTLQKFEFNCIEGEQTEDEKVIGIVTLTSTSECTHLLLDEESVQNNYIQKCCSNVSEVMGKIYHIANLPLN